MLDVTRFPIPTTSFEFAGRSYLVPKDLLITPWMARRIGDWAAITSTRNPILLRGEPGSGKEAMVLLLHVLAGRAGVGIGAINCAEKDGKTFVADVFGVVKGAYTGAEPRQGQAELVGRGTLFFDECANLDEQAQGALLRFLPTRRFSRMGQPQVIRDFQGGFVFATNRKIEGVLRDDLVDRLTAVEIAIPPLRERPEDVQPLLEHLVAQHWPGGARPFHLDESNWRYLRALPWRKNVRGLEQFAERVAVRLAGSAITLEDLQDLQPELCRSKRRSPTRTTSEEELTALTLEGGNYRRAARRLKIHRATLYAHQPKVQV